MQRARPSRYAIGGAGWSHCLAVAFTTAVAYSTSLEGPERGNMWKPGRSMQIYADLTTKHGKHGKHGVRGPFWRELEFGGPLHPGINRRLWPSWDVHSPAPWLHWPEFACAMRHKLQNQATDKSWLQPEQLVGSGSLMLVLEYIEYMFPRSQGM